MGSSLGRCAPLCSAGIVLLGFHSPACFPSHTGSWFQGSGSGAVAS